MTTANLTDLARVIKAAARLGHSYGFVTECARSMQRSVWLVEVETIVSQLLDREGHRLILRLNAVAHVSDNRRGIANRELYTVLGLCERSYRWWFIRSSAAIGNESSTYTITATFTDIEGKVYRSTGPRVK